MLLAGCSHRCRSQPRVCTSVQQTRPASEHKACCRSRPFSCSTPASAIVWTLGAMKANRHVHKPIAGNGPDKIPISSQTRSLIARATQENDACRPPCATDRSISRQQYTRLALAALSGVATSRAQQLHTIVMPATHGADRWIWLSHSTYAGTHHMPIRWIREPDRLHNA